MQICFEHSTLDGTIDALEFALNALTEDGYFLAGQSRARLDINKRTTIDELQMLRVSLLMAKRNAGRT